MNSDLFFRLLVWNRGSNALLLSTKKPTFELWQRWGRLKRSKKSFSLRLTVYINFSDDFSYDNVDSFDIVQIENDIDLDCIPLINDFYELQSLTDLTLTKEFRILHAAAAPSSAHAIKSQQTEAQKEASKLLW